MGDAGGVNRVRKPDMVVRPGPCYLRDMTKLDLALARIARLPPDRQEAIAIELGYLLDGEESGESLLTDDQWAEVQRRLDDPSDPLLSHEEVAVSFANGHT
jgi:hypothetical protein